MKEVETFEPPREYTPSNIHFWEPITKSMQDQKGKVLRAKAKKFLEEGCIKQLSIASWMCTPIKGYNKKSYYINSIQDGFECDCQGFKQKLKEYEGGHSDQKPICSHILAVIQFNFIETNREKKFYHGGRW